MCIINVWAYLTLRQPAFCIHICKESKVAPVGSELRPSLTTLGPLGGSGRRYRVLTPDSLQSIR